MLLLYVFYSPQPYVLTRLPFLPMVNDFVPYVSSTIIIIWGIIHIILTRRMVKGFEPTSVDNRRIITMGWVSGGFMLIFVGLLVGLVNYIYGGCPFTYPMCASMLLVMAAWTTATGSRTSATFLKISPAVEAIVAIMILYSELVYLHVI